MNPFKIKIGQTQRAEASDDSDDDTSSDEDEKESSSMQTSGKVMEASDLINSEDSREGEE